VSIKWNDASDWSSFDVYIVPHSHDDVGWLRTVDDYYTTTVHYILDTVFSALYENPERRFTQVEITYLEKYYKRQKKAKRDIIKTVISRGQVEFNLGGMTMNDEATTTYVEEVNQMSNGAAFLLQEFGVTPKSAWHIDPFGHSASTASLWSQMGFSAFGICRVPSSALEWMKKK